MKKYLFWVKKNIIGETSLPLTKIDIVFALIFGTVFLPVTIFSWVIRKSINH